VYGINREIALQKLSNPNLNPFILVIFVRMCFCSWLRYTGYIKE